MIGVCARINAFGKIEAESRVFTNIEPEPSVMAFFTCSVSCKRRFAYHVSLQEGGLLHCSLVCRAVYHYVVPRGRFGSLPEAALHTENVETLG